MDGKTSQKTTGSQLPYAQLKGTWRWLVLVGAGLCFNTNLAAAPSAKVRSRVSNSLDVRSQQAIAKRMADGGSADVAVQLYRSLVQQSPKDSDLRLEFAQALSDAGKLDEALYEFSSLATDPVNRTAAAAGVAHIHLVLADTAKALAVIDTVPLAEQSPRLLLLAGVAYDRLGDHQTAQSRYRAALAQDSRSIGIRNNLALSLALSGNYDEAVGILRILVASSDATQRIRQNLAFVYGLMGKADLAAQTSAVDLSAADVTNNLNYYRQLKP